MENDKKKRVVLTEKASRVKFWKGTVKQAKQIHFCMFASWLFTGSSLCWLYRLEMVLIFQLILTNIEPVNRFRHLPKDFGLLPVLEHIYSIISFALLHAEPHPKVCTGWLDLAQRELRFFQRRSWPVPRTSTARIQRKWHTGGVGGIQITPLVVY